MCGLRHVKYLLFNIYRGAGGGGAGGGAAAAAGGAAGGAGVNDDPHRTSVRCFIHMCM